MHFLNKNVSNFNLYLKEEYRKKVKRHNIDKQNISGNVEKGAIFIYQETLDLPEWASYLDILSGKSIGLPDTQIVRAAVFLTIKGDTRLNFAITFGYGSTLLDPEYIIPDFGLTVSKSLLTIGEIIAIDSTSIDRKIFNTKKQSVQFLMPEKLLEYGTQNIVKNVYGVHKQMNSQFSLGGKDSLNFSGEIDILKDLGNWLNQFAELFNQGQNNLGIPDDLIIVNKHLQQQLDKKLAQKILSIINTNPITRKQTSGVTIAPNESFDLENFTGFFITGQGYKRTQISSDFSIDELNFFERFQKQIKPNKKNAEGILSKIKTDKISRRIDTGDTELVCSVYKAINFKTKLHSKDYILISGKWYEVDKDFYHRLKMDIDTIESPNNSNSIIFIDFDPKKHKEGSSLSEGKYNEDLARSNKVLLLDQKNYHLDERTRTKYGFKPRIPIELCDLLLFTNQKVQFIHVKRHSGASGTSHLLSQAIVSAHAFLNDSEAVINHINKKINESNLNPSIAYTLPKLIDENQKKEVVLVIVDKEKPIKNGKPNSAMLSLLEMISMRENIRNLEYLGFKCYLKFVPGNE
ncbi:DUF6119 family protein [Bacillus velezensis]